MIPFEDVLKDKLRDITDPKLTDVEMNDIRASIVGKAQTVYEEAGKQPGRVGAVRFDEEFPV